MLLELEKLENDEIECQTRQAVKDIADTLFIDFLLNQKLTEGLRVYQETFSGVLTSHLPPEVASLLNELQLSDLLKLTVIGTQNDGISYKLKTIEADQEPLDIPPRSYLTILENHEDAPTSRLWMMLTPAYDVETQTKVQFGVNQNLPDTNLLQITTFRNSISGTEVNPLTMIGLARKLEDSLRRTFRPRSTSP